MNASRRTFLIASLGAASSLAVSRMAFAAPQHLSESEADAQAQGYKEDATKVDASRFPSYKPGQSCANCSLFQGSSADKWSGCVLFGDRLVASSGWCASYTNT
ncbi:high-potential iron-sulfur protein [Trinickia fusca]|uniref:High-potential iron-sulfur protein n=1 Tax=Trinickia fusca TaxID=2419777 RepID=A0A494XER6_9BURK|nr:high-potential iron-sulfur protein [Trinickia fusca]RKP46083.1 High potential iron-sulfur protein [Trinickia fusca]